MGLHWPITANRIRTRRGPCHLGDRNESIEQRYIPTYMSRAAATPSAIRTLRHAGKSKSIDGAFCDMMGTHGAAFVQEFP